MQSYTDLFAVRGSAYDRAMQNYPHARDAEFAQAVRAGSIKPGMVIADVPAGGRYMVPHLPAGCTCLEHEPCASFSHHGGSRTPDAADSPNADAGDGLLPLPWGEASVDVVVSLAGVHHLEDKRPLFADMLRVVVPGGRLVLSDVAEGSAPAHFLDNFVGDHNSTGHEGVFLDDRTVEELTQSGWVVRSKKLEEFHWTFRDRMEMADFCRWLFDICKASPEQIASAVEQDLGTDIVPEGLGIRWSLMTIVAEKAA